MTMSSGVFLEDWLHEVASSATSTSFKSAAPPAPSARQIAHAWTQLRTCVQNGSLESEHLAALMFLKECGRTLHVADAQARLLVSILSSVTSADADALGQARTSAIMILSAWIRKACKVSSGHWPSRESAKGAQGILSSVLDGILKALENSSNKRNFICEAILLLGALCVPLQMEPESLRICQEALLRECVQQKQAIVLGRFEEALSGMGYAIVSSRGEKLRALIQTVLLLWSGEQGPTQEKWALSSPSLEDGLLLLHLMQWCAANLLSQPQLAGMAIAQVIVDELLKARLDSKNSTVKCAIVLSAAGLSRSLYRSSSQDQKLAGAELTWSSIMRSLQSMVVDMADSTLRLQVQLISEKLETISPENAPYLEDGLRHSYLSCVSVEEIHFLFCLGLALSYCSGFPPSPSALLCLTVTLLEGALPLSGFYIERIRSDNFDRKPGGQGNVGNTWFPVEKQLAVHVDGALFREAGTISRVFCQQYQSAEKGWQVWIENLLCQSAQSLYKSQRHFLTLSQSTHNPSNPVSLITDRDKEALGKINGAFFLLAFLFFSFATKEKTHAEVHTKGCFAVQVLKSLSCVESNRQGPVHGYSNLVQTCVAWVSASQAASASLTEMFPSYDDVLHPPGPDFTHYSWTADTIQDARMLFCFRVLTPCLEQFPASTFFCEIAPLLLLYLGHPNSNLAQVSHSLFVAFIRCDGDSQQPKNGGASQGKDRDMIKEELAVCYMERTLEIFQGVSHFSFLVMGVSAIVRHLPAGSTATMHCISCLVEKAHELFRVECEDSSCVGEQMAAPVFGDELKTAEKLQTLLIHLVLAVDIQVLPFLLQEIARLILGMTEPHRTRALEEAFDILAGSTDLTRKHVIVPWLQSLSYICSKQDNKEKSQNSRSSGIAERGLKCATSSNDIKVAQSGGAVHLNPNSASENMRHIDGSFLTERDSEASFLPCVSRSRL